MYVDVLLEVRVAMCHRDVDIGQLDLVIVPKMLVLRLTQDDVPCLGVILMWWTGPEVPEDDVLKTEVGSIPCRLLKLVVDVLDVDGCWCDVGSILLDVEL